MGLLGQVLTGVVASRMGGRMGGPLGGALGGGLGGGFGGPLGGALGGAVLGGMGRGGRGSPVMKALLLLLAAKAARDYMQRRQGGAQGGGFAPSGMGQGGMGQGGGMGQAGAGQGGGGFGGLGGLLGGVAGGGGLGALVEQFNRTGHGDAINSWIGRGPNKPLPPQQLAEALGPDTVQALSQETGLPQDEVLQELSETLPDAVDQLSPDGTPPDPSVLEGDDEDLQHLRAAP